MSYLMPSALSTGSWSLSRSRSFTYLALSSTRTDARTESVAGPFGELDIHQWHMSISAPVLKRLLVVRWKLTSVIHIKIVIDGVEGFSGTFTFIIISSPFQCKIGTARR